MNQLVKKAIIPAAGLGTRFLPVTRTLPKELLPILTKPTLQYVVEEGYASGIREFIFVIAPDKPNPAKHFLPNEAYDKKLMAKGKTQWLTKLNEIISDIKITCVEQCEPLGLGHAVLMGENAVGDEPFAVMLPDEIYDSPTPCLKQLILAFKKLGVCLNGTEEVPPSEVDQYGIYDISSSDGMIHKAKGVIEKPSLEKAPSRFNVIGRYIFKPKVFSILKGLKPGRGGEIQLADAQDQLAKAGEFYAVEFEGQRFDTGNPLGFLAATIHYGIKAFGREKVSSLL